MSTLSAIEIMKFRRLGIWVIPAIMTLGVIGLSLFRAVASGALDDPEQLWKLMLASMSFAFALIYPLLLAVLSSRIVDIEHRGNGWLLSASSSLLPGQLLRSKFMVTGTVIIIVTALISATVAVVGFLADAGWAFPTSTWFGYTLALILVSLIVLATHLTLSLAIENQLVCLAIGIAGLFLAVFGQAFPGWVNHLTPWGYFNLILPADYVGTELQYFELPLASIRVLGLVGIMAFPLVCRYFDRKEL